MPDEENMKIKPLKEQYEILKKYFPNDLSLENRVKILEEKVDNLWKWRENH
jgi:hypothetical protein